MENQSKFCFSVFSTILIFLMSNCVSVRSDYPSDPYYNYSGHYQRGWNNRNYYNPYGGSFYGPRGNGYYGHPAYRGGGGGNGHNPMHVPSGRYKNFGSPGKWRL